MNPVRGIETLIYDHKRGQQIYFQINESRSRDWNLPIPELHTPPAIVFQINESRSRDWNIFS